MSAKGQITEGASAARFLKPVAVSVAAGAIVCTAILLLLAAVVSGGGVPQSLIGPMATFAMSVGAFTAGLCCAKAVHKNGLMCGLACGIIFAILIFIGSFASPDNGLGLGALIKLMFILFSAMIGGVLGVNTKRRKK